MIIPGYNVSLSMVEIEHWAVPSSAPDSLLFTGTQARHEDFWNLFSTEWTGETCNEVFCSRTSLGIDPTNL